MEQYVKPKMEIVDFETENAVINTLIDDGLTNLEDIIINNS